MLNVRNFKDSFWKKTMTPTGVQTTQVYWTAGLVSPDKFMKSPWDLWSRVLVDWVVCEVCADPVDIYQILLCLKFDLQISDVMNLAGLTSISVEASCLFNLLPERLETPVK